MGTKIFVHSGFSFALKGEVILGLVLTHLVGKDLRTAERLLDGFFLDLMMVAQERFGDQINRRLRPSGSWWRAIPSFASGWRRPGGKCAARPTS